MVTNFAELVVLCEDELKCREYGTIHYCKIKTQWNKLGQWMQKHQHNDFSEQIGLAYCDEVFGNHILADDISKGDRIGLRATRMLISYQKDGDFEFRTPSMERVYSGDNGKNIKQYLAYAKDVLNLSHKTIQNKEHYLHAFCVFLNEHCLNLDDLNVDSIKEFYTIMEYSPASRHNCGSALRIFFRYAYENGLTQKDCSIFVPADNYRKHCKIPTTYEEAEIQKIIASVERASAIGKRDYLVILLAAEYGWRSKDIVNFCFDQIDWDKNVICFNLSKTGVPVEYPLLSSVGNAIIDYLKHGRPKTDAREIIVSANRSKKGQPLSSPTIHSIISRYMNKANIKNWKTKKHGAHSLRHSLATNMLKKNISMPVISAVMGHQSTQSTKVYLAVDVDKLRQCPLSMPLLHSPHFKREV